MNKKPVTEWSKFNLDIPGWEHSHIQDGHIMAAEPIGTPEQNKAWSGHQWKHEHKHLINGKLV